MTSRFHGSEVPFIQQRKMGRMFKVSRTNFLEPMELRNCGTHPDHGERAKNRSLA
jgi:hypothetical protein